MRALIRFFDRLEDTVRIHLSHYPIVYALVGAVGVILVWKGIWETAEFFPILFGPASLVLGVVILLATGLLVSFFIGDNIIISGFRREKKLAEKTEREVQAEAGKMDEILAELKELEQDVEELKTRE